MAFRYMKNDILYSIYFDDEKPDTLRFSDGEKQKRLKVRKESGYAVNIRKGFVGCGGGAVKLFAFLCDTAKDGFMTIYIDGLIRDFYNEKSKRWIAA